MILFAELLRDHRVRAGLSQNGLAKMIHCDHAYINRVENRKQNMSRHFVESAARELNLDAYDSAQLLASAGYWPWPDVRFRDVISILTCGQEIS